MANIPLPAHPHEFMPYPEPKTVGLNQLGKFYLILLFMLGNFFLTNVQVFAEQPFTRTVTTSELYNASFSFNVVPFSQRRTFAESATLNSSGTPFVISPVPEYTGDFPDWANSVPAAGWTSINSSSSTVIANSISAGFTQFALPPDIPAGSFVLSWINADEELWIGAYSTEANLFKTSIAGFPRKVVQADTSKSYAMILTSQRCHFFWTDGTNFKHQLLGEISENIIAGAQPADKGVSGCTITWDGKEYVLASFIDLNDGHVKVMVFEDADDPSLAQIEDFDLGVIISPAAYITANSRTGNVYILFFNGAEVKNFKSGFKFPGPWPNQEVPVNFGAGWSAASNHCNNSLANFETCMGITKIGTPDIPINRYVHDVLLRESIIEDSHTFSTSGFPFPSSFYYRISSTDYLGMVILRSSINYEFLRRPLQFPKQASWNPVTNYLHIEGPPLLNTDVSVHVIYPEIVPASCTALMANCAGAAAPFNGQSGVIINTGNEFGIAFDRPMLQASYSTWLTDGKIKLLRPDNSEFPLTFTSGSAYEMIVSNADPFEYSTQYRFSIASDMLDLIGSQLWEPATLTFTTQNTFSTMIASEVQSILAFSDAARTSPIQNNGEINATSTIYLLVTAIDPAFNTIDYGTASYYLNGSFVASITLAQTVPATSTFLGSRYVELSTSQDHLLHIRTASSTVILNLYVDFPVPSPLIPASGATGVLIGDPIKIQLSESIDFASVTPSTVRILKAGSPIDVSYTYDDPTRVITITPDSPLTGETDYTVEVKNLADAVGNPQIQQLSFNFTTEDVSRPTLAAHFPAQGASSVSIDSRIVLTLSESVLAASVTPSTVILRRNAAPAAYTINTVGSYITLIPSDLPGQGMFPATGYTLEIGPSVTDPSGNQFLSVPATFTLNFTTQPANSPPATISSFTLFANSARTIAFLGNEAVCATSTVYLTMSADDEATQTQDISTATLKLSWNGDYSIQLTETASNSGGTFQGQFNLSSIPLYDLPLTLPPIPTGALSWIPEADQSHAATLTVFFPRWDASSSQLETLTGPQTASGASNVRLDSEIDVSFDSQIASTSISPSGIGLFLEGAPIATTKTLSGDQRTITLTPSAILLPGKTYSVSAIQSGTGLKSPLGNPLFRSFDFSFSTQASQTQPVNITQVSLFPNASFNVAEALNDNADYPATGTIFIEFQGTDVSDLTIDSTIASISTGATITLTETSVNSGTFIGSCAFTALPDRYDLKIQSAVSPDKQKTLTITYPSLTIVGPASGTTDVSIFASVKVKSDESLDPSTLIPVNVNLASAGMPIPCDILYSDATYEITLVPVDPLPFETVLTADFRNIRDPAGNPLTAPVSFTFKTQTTTPSPTEIHSIWIYEDSDLNDSIPQNGYVNPEQQVFIKVIATDLSPATLDSTPVQVISAATTASRTVWLIETAIDSGIFTNSTDIFNEENSTITIFSKIEPGISHTLKTRFKPYVSSVSPLSGTTNLALDSSFVISANNPIDINTISSFSIKLSDSSGSIIATFSLSAPDEITIEPALREGKQVNLQVTTALTDIYSQGFSVFNASYTTRQRGFSSFDLALTDQFTSLLATGSQVEANSTVWARLTATNMLEKTQETLAGYISSSLGNQPFTMIEGDPGIFVGSFTVPGLSEEDLFAAPLQAPSLGMTLNVPVGFPSVSPFIPASGAINVPLWETIRIKANKAIDPISLNLANVKLIKSGVEVAGVITYDDATRMIYFTPDQPFSESTEYHVEVANLKDLAGNNQPVPLKYMFTSGDTTSPTLIRTEPVHGETNVTIDRLIILEMSEAIDPLSVTTSTITLRRNGNPAEYSFQTVGSYINILPEDIQGGGLLPETTYSLAIGPSVTDPAGNPFSNSPATFSMTFSTQKANNPPIVITSLSTFKDPFRISGFSENENIYAGSEIYLKMTGIDASPQTRDISTITLNLSWGGEIQFPIEETASNSGGLFYGQYNLTDIPLFGFPAPLPMASIGTLTWITYPDPLVKTTLNVTFPQWDPGKSTATVLSGIVPASGASSVRLNSPLNIAFDSPMSADSILSEAIGIYLNGIPLETSRTLNSDSKILELKPVGDFSPGLTYTVKGLYQSGGLRNLLGNPLFCNFEFKFTTQGGTVSPSSITKISLFPDAAFNPMTELSQGDDYSATGTVFIEMRGIDASDITTDTTSASVSTGQIVVLTETGLNSGVFRGSCNFAALPNRFMLDFQSSVSPELRKSLYITYPELSIVSPASGANDVSIFTTVQVNADERLDADTILTSGAGLSHNGVSIPHTVEYSASEMRITLIPTAALPLNSVITARFSGIEDLAGNPQTKDLAYQFRTQKKTTPPQNILSMQIFDDPSMTVPLNAEAFVNPGQEVFIRITAVDLSVDSIDSTGITTVSRATGASQTRNLLETSNNSGIFTGSARIPSEENSTIDIFSVTSPAISQPLRIRSKPRFISANPSFGSINLALDTIIVMTANNPIDANSISVNSVKVTDTAGSVIATFTLSAPDELSIEPVLTESKILFLQISGLLKDVFGQEFAPLTTSFTTRTRKYDKFALSLDPAFGNLLLEGSVVNIGTDINAILLATDLYDRKAEEIPAFNTHPSGENIFKLHERKPGEYLGSFTVPLLPGQDIFTAPLDARELGIMLRVSDSFHFVSVSPGDGETAVPLDVWPTWTFSYPLDPACLTSQYFSLKSSGDKSEIPGSLSFSNDNTKVIFRPDSFLKILTGYTLTLDSQLKDITGRILGTKYETSFTTQAPPPPPSKIISLMNYRNSDYLSAWTGINPSGTLYLEIIAEDLSFSTVDSTRVRLNSSDGMINSVELNLIETSANSGIFRAPYPTQAPVGSTVTVQSQADPSFVLNLKVYSRPVLVSISPASGSSGLHLDQPISLHFDREMDLNSADNGLQISTETGEASGILVEGADAGKTIIIKPVLIWEEGEKHLLKVSETLFDTNGSAIIPELIAFTTRYPESCEMELLSGLPPLAMQPVSVLREALPGMLNIAATTTKLLHAASETRRVRIFSREWAREVELTESETTPGFFTGIADLPIKRGEAATATLFFGPNSTVGFIGAPIPRLLTLMPASGALNIADTTSIEAAFSKPMALQFASMTPVISIGNSRFNAALIASRSTNLHMVWQPKEPLTVGATCTISFSPLYDLLGQRLDIPGISFSVGGTHGITLFEDAEFTRPITGQYIMLPKAYVEVAAISSANAFAGGTNLDVQSTVAASFPVDFPLKPAFQGSRRFRTGLVFERTRSVPEGFLPLMPGERVEFFSPMLTPDRKVYYYKTSGDSPPLSIRSIAFFNDIYCQRPVEDALRQMEFFTEIIAEDRNWLNIDTTPVNVRSDSDLTGFDSVLVESGEHTERFRIGIQLDLSSSLPQRKVLKAKPGDRITVTSLADSTITASMRFQPENRLENAIAWPSPVRGDKVTFSFYLTFPGMVELFVYDTAGDELYYRSVRGERGENRITWILPRRMANGAYFFKLILESETQFQTTKKTAKGKFAVLR